MKRVILVDFMGSAYYHHHAKDGNLVYNFTKNIREIANTFSVDKIVLLQEGGSEYRKNLLPTYKAARRERREKQTEAEKNDYLKFIESTNTLIDTLKLLGIHTLQVFGAEADDLAGYLCAVLPYPEYQLLLLSEDSDWSQLLSRPNTVQGSYKTMAKKIAATGYVTPDDWLSWKRFCSTKGLTPDQWFEKKMLTGDTSDSIPGIDGLGDTGATRLIEKYGSIKEILINKENLDIPRLTAKAKANIIDSDEVLKLGYSLMNLRWTPEQWEVIVKLDTSKIAELINNGLQAENVVQEAAFTELCYVNGWIDFIDNPRWFDAFS